MIRTLLLALFLQHHKGGAHSFEDVEKWVREFEDEERIAWQKPDEVVSALGLTAGSRVADIGAGSGLFSRRFARAVGDKGIVYAVDIEPGMLRHIADRAKKENQANIVPVLGGADDPHLAPSSVDLIFICDTIHHVDDRASYYAILKRDLTPQGRLVIVDFEKREGAKVGPPLEMRIAKEEIVGEIERAGFRLQKDVTLLPHQYFLIFSTP